MNTQGGRDAYRDHIGGFYTSGSKYGQPYLRSGWVWERVKFPASGSSFPRGYWNGAVHPVAVPAMMALASVMLHENYLFRETAGGTVSMRNIKTISKTRVNEQVRRQYPLATSIHAHGGAIDINPSKNRYGRGTDEIDSTNVPRLAKAIKTVGGFTVFRWGGDWSNDDGMHFECIACTRPQLEAGINASTVIGWNDYLAWIGGAPPSEGDDEMSLLGYDIGKMGQPSVKGLKSGTLQAMLIDRGYDLGTFGPNGDGVDQSAGDSTRKALHDWKIAAGITEATSGGEGKIGQYEYSALHPDVKKAAGGGDHPDSDHSSLATKVVVDAHVADVKSDTPHS